MSIETGPRSVVTPDALMQLSQILPAFAELILGRDEEGPSELDMSVVEELMKLSTTLSIVAEENRKIEGWLSVFAEFVHETGMDQSVLPEVAEYSPKLGDDMLAASKAVVAWKNDPAFAAYMAAYASEFSA